MWDALITMLDGWIFVGFMFYAAHLFVRAMESTKRADD